MGEATVPATLLLEGKVPWRDFLFVHGLMEDVLRAIPGMLRWGGIWGATAGQTLWVLPVGMITLGLLYQHLLRTNTAALLIVLLLVLAPITQVGFGLHQRFILEPLTLIACLLFHTRPTLGRAAFFAFLTVCGLFTTAETFFFALAYAAITVLADLQWRRPGSSIVFCLRRTFLFGAFSLGFIGLGFAVLGYFGALRPFLDFHLSTASGHRFAGGLPIPPLEATFFLLNLLTVSAAVLYALACWRRGQRLSPEELTMGAVAIFALLYYQKFLSRADLPHFMIYWAPVTPLLFYVFARALTALDEKMPRRLRAWVAHPVSVLLLLVLLGARWPKISGALRAADSQPVLTTNTFSPALGPLNVQQDISESVRALRAYFQSRAYNGPVFDFTNQPLLFHHFLGMPPVTRFAYVSLAIHPYLQTRLVKELDEARPRFVVYAKGPRDSKEGSWDSVHNMVRHYQVSRYLLDHYVPVAWVAEHLLLERADTGAQPLGHSTWQPIAACRWGSVLANWSAPYAQAPAASAAATTSQMGGKQQTVIAVPPAFRGKGVTLDLFIDEAQKGPVYVETPGGGMGWNMHAGKQRRYRVPLGSCPQWQTIGEKLVIQHVGNLRIAGVDWILEPVKGFSEP